MKNNLGSFLGLSRLGAGAAFLALCAFAPSSRADVIIVDNTGVMGSGFVSDSSSLAQEFTMSGSGADLSSVTVVLGGSGSANVSVYDTSGSGGSPGNLLLSLGSANGSALGTSTTFNLSPGDLSLAASASYAIVLSSSATVTWAYTTSVGSGTGTWGDIYSGPPIWSDRSGIDLGGHFLQMEVQAVPEVPITGLVMGFGALAIGLGYTLQRKLCPAV